LSRFEKRIKQPGRELRRVPELGEEKANESPILVKPRPERHSKKGVDTKGSYKRGKREAQRGILGRVVPRMKERLRRNGQSRIKKLSKQKHQNGGKVKRKEDSVCAGPEAGQLQREKTKRKLFKASGPKEVGEEDKG